MRGAGRGEGRRDCSAVMVAGSREFGTKANANASSSSSSSATAAHTALAGLAKLACRASANSGRRSLLLSHALLLLLCLLWLSLLLLKGRSE